MRRGRGTTVQGNCGWVSKRNLLDIVTRPGENVQNCLFKVLQAQAGSVPQGPQHVRGWGAMAEITAARKEAKGMFILLRSF